MKFARIFDVDNGQVLYQVRMDDLGNPGVQVVTLVNGVRVTSFTTWPTWEIAETKLANIRQVDAAAFYVGARAVPAG